MAEAVQGDVDVGDLDLLAADGDRGRGGAGGSGAVKGGRDSDRRGVGERGRLAVEADDRVVEEGSDVDRLAVGTDGNAEGAAQALLCVTAAGCIAGVGDAAQWGQSAGCCVAIEADDRVVEPGGDVYRLAVGADGDVLGAVQTLLGGAAAGDVARVRDAPGPGQGTGCCVAIEAGNRVIVE